MHAISYPVGVFVDVNIVSSILINRVTLSLRSVLRKRKERGRSFGALSVPHGDLW